MEASGESEVDIWGPGATLFGGPGISAPGSLGFWLFEMPQESSSGPFMIKKTQIMGGRYENGKDYLCMLYFIHFLSFAGMLPIIFRIV